MEGRNSGAARNYYLESLKSHAHFHHDSGTKHSSPGSEAVPTTSQFCHRICDISLGPQIICASGEKNDTKKVRDGRALRRKEKERKSDCRAIRKDNVCVCA